MGNNFYTKYVDGTTKFNVAGLDPPFGELDKAIGYHQNLIIHTDGIVEYDILTGKLSWSSIIRIFFNASDGTSVSNTIASGSVTLSDGQIAYIDINEIDATVITVTAATVSLAAASNFIQVARLVLGYRNTNSNQYFPIHLPLFDGTLRAAIQTTDSTVTTLANLTLSEGKSYHVEARVIAREGDIVNTSAYIRRALVSRATGGSAVLQGTDVDVWTLESSSAAAWDIELDVNSNDVRLRVTGDASTTIEWKCIIRLIEV